MKNSGALLLTCIWATAAYGQAGDGQPERSGNAGQSTAEADSVQSADAAEREQPRRGPKFLNLRYDDDFSYLAGPADSLLILASNSCR